MSHRSSAAAFAVPLAVAALLAALPVHSHAQGAPQPPRWSLGAGIATAEYAYTFGALAGTSLGALFVAQDAVVPAVTASVERAIGPRTWVVLGVRGSFESEEYDADTTGAAAYRTRDARTASGSVGLGVRRVLTPPIAWAEVSGIATLDAGYLHLDATRFDGAGTPYDEAWRGTVAGLSGGLAVERELTAGISLRIATSLARVSYTRAEVTTSGTEAPGVPYTRRDRGTSWGGSVALAPRLELRVAF